MSILRNAHVALSNLGVEGHYRDQEAVARAGNSDREGRRGCGGVPAYISVLGKGVEIDISSEGLSNIMNISAGSALTTHTYTARRPRSDRSNVADDFRNQTVTFEIESNRRGYRSKYHSAIPPPVRVDSPFNLIVIGRNVKCVNIAMLMCNMVV